MAVDWFYELDGFRRGPVASGELKKLADTGAITPETLIWRDGLEEWVKAGAVRGLFATPAAAAAPRPSAKPASAKSDPVLPPAATEQKWYYAISGSQVGPVTFDEIKRLVSTGFLSRRDLVWNDDLDDWATASSVKGLFPKPLRPPPLPSSAGASGDVAPRVEAAAAATLVAAKEVVGRLSQGQSVGGFHVQRVGIGVSAALGAFATFLPWVTAPIIGTMYGISGPDGWLNIALFVPAIVLCFLGDRKTLVTGWRQYCAAAPAVVASLIGIYKMWSLGSSLRQAVANAGSNPFAKVASMAAANNTQLGSGIYLLSLAGLCVAAAAFAIPRLGRDRQ